MTEHCPDCDGRLALRRDQNYKIVYECEDCHLLWDETLTKKARKWKGGFPLWEN